jgi:uridine monophosphate synthetase
MNGGRYTGGMTFFESLEDSAHKKGGPLCVGIDPRIEPGDDIRDRLISYGRRVVDACAPYCVAFKPQLAFFERHGAEGWSALEAVLEHIRSIDSEFPVILDAKRGDIGSTAEAYAQALLDRPGNLAVTLSPYLGKESAEPFLKRKGRGAFILCRTTNPGAGRLQERILDDGTPLFLAVSDEALSWEPDSAGTSIGLVVAGNDPAILGAVRNRHPDPWFLAPGIGAQGGKADQAIAAGARTDGFGVLVSASRSVADAADPAAAARELRDSLDKARSALKTKTGSRFAAANPVNIRGVSMRLTPAERKELLVGLFRIGAFQTGEFTLKSGLISPFYLDLRRIGADPRILSLTGRAYGELLEGLKADHLAGIPVAALPLAAAASLATGRSLIYPRLEKKAHGSGARVEGVWKAGDVAVMLDDLITTGGSKREAAAVLREAGLEVRDLVVLIERGDEGRRDMAEAGISLRAWARVEDLLEAGLDAGYLDRDMARRVMDFTRKG